MKQQFFTAAGTLALAFTLTSYSSNSEALPEESIYSASQCQPTYGSPKRTGSAARTIDILPWKIVNNSNRQQWVTCPIDNEDWHPDGHYKTAFVVHKAPVGNTIPLICYFVNVYARDVMELNVSRHLYSGPEDTGLMLGRFPTYNPKEHRNVLHQAIQCQIPPGGTIYYYRPGDILL
jgi:hypothetical protein